MGKVKFGQGVADIRGKIGGTVFSRNRYGAYAREKVTPVNPLTPRQVLVRGRVEDLAKNWASALTEDQRNAWRNFAENNPITDVFGNPLVLSGIAMYERLNLVLYNLGVSLLDNPPVDLNVDPISSASITFTSNAVGVPQEVKIAFTPTPSPADHRLYVFSTPPLTPGVNFYVDKYRWLIAGGALQASPFDVKNAWISKFGNAPVGSKVAFLVAHAQEKKGVISVGLVAAVNVTLAP